jgi:hypothetical protein
MDAETVEHDDDAVAATFDGRRWRFPWLEVCAGVVYAAALIAYTARYGAPLKTTKIFIAIMLGLLVPTLRRPRHWLRGVVRDWVPLLVILTSYDLLRGRADNVNTVVHFEPQLGFDKLLTGGSTFANVFQDALWRGHPSWYDHIVSTIYLSHFCVTLVTLAVLWVVRESTFRRYRNYVLVLVLAGFATYFLYPAAPPWCAAENGFTPPIVRTAYKTLGVSTLGDCTPGAGSSLSNPIAALPSLHAAFPLALTLFFWSRARRWMRAVLVTYTAAMAFVLMYGGEHFLFDEVLGWLYAVTAFVVLRRIWQRADLTASAET